LLSKLSSAQESVGSLTSINAVHAVESNGPPDEVLKQLCSTLFERKNA